MQVSVGPIVIWVGCFSITFALVLASKRLHVSLINTESTERRFHYQLNVKERRVPKTGGGSREHFELRRELAASVPEIHSSCSPVEK